MRKKNRKYKAAVIGCGRIGAEEKHYRKEIRPGTHAGAYEKHSEIELVGLVDTNQKKLRAAFRYFPGASLYSSAEKMIRETKPDIISVATYSDSHLSLVKLCARYKIKAIICEKPISESIKQAEEMIGVCKKSKSLLFINHSRRFDPVFRKFKQNIEEKKLGRILQGTYYYYNGIFNTGTHMVDILRFFLGEIDWAMGIENKKTRTLRLNKDLNIDGILRFKNGAMVAFQSLPENYGFSELYLYGDKGALFLKEHIGYRMEYRELIKNEYFKGYHQLNPRAQLYGKPRSYMISVVDHVVGCLDGREEQVGRGEDGLMALKTLFALKASAQKKGKIIRLN